MVSAYGLAFIYEPLFGRNYATGLNGSLILVIGTSLAWNADGSKVTVTVNPQAKWSDG